MVERVAIGTATNKYRLIDEEEWITVGAGPLLLTASNPIIYALSDDIPEGDEGFVLQRGAVTYIPIAKLVWVAARNEGGVDVFVAGPEI